LDGVITLPAATGQEDVHRSEAQLAFIDGAEQ
jgi:hypothetical protein